MENKDWKSIAKSYSENNIFGKRLRTYYDEKNVIVHCEAANVDRGDLLKNIKRLQSKDLNKDAKPYKKKHNPKKYFKKKKNDEKSKGVPKTKDNG